MLVHFTLKHTVKLGNHTASLLNTHTHTLCNMTDRHGLSMQAANFITRNVFCEISVYRAAKSVNVGNLNLPRLTNYNLYIVIEHFTRNFDV